MKKKTILNTLFPAKSTSKNPVVNNPVQQVYKTTSEQIRKGLEKPCASTGTPMEDLHGGAEFMARMSNIGGGSKATGGGGVKSGFNIITNNQKAKALIDAQEKAQKAITKKKK